MVEYCALGALQINVANGNTLLFTLGNRAPVVSDEELADRLRFLAFVESAGLVDIEQWNGEEEHPEEHFGQTGEDLEVCIGTVSQSEIRVIVSFLWKLEFKFLKNGLSQLRFERLFLLSAAAAEFTAATNLLPAGSLPQWVPILNILDGIADNSTRDFLFFGELALLSPIHQLLLFA